MNTHPKALEAQERARQLAEERQINKQFVDELTKRGVRFFEIHPRVAPKEGRLGVMTLAYYKDRHNIVAVANALCHPDEQFDKLRGRAIAGRRMTDGNVIVLRKPTNSPMSDANWLDYKFREY